jgi:predicted TIM-barrel fold metal-dependent hydrolase
MYRLFSVDDHVVEPADVWSGRVPARFREHAPHVVEQDGREVWVYENKTFPTIAYGVAGDRFRIGGEEDPAMPLDTLDQMARWGIARFADMSAACYRPADRARDLQANGCYASISFPSFPRFGGARFLEFKDTDLASACVQAWNDFILDEWCPGGPPGQFVPMILGMLWDPEATVAEIRRCQAKGARALCWVSNSEPLGLPNIWDDQWDPIWDICAQENLPVCMHIGSSGVNIDPSPGVDAPLPQALTIGSWIDSVNFMMSPVPRKFPDIKLVFAEGGIGWIPAALERADRAWARHGFTKNRPHPWPSEVFRRNMFVCMIDEPVGISLHHLIGDENILAELDYPHVDTSYPDTQTVMDGLLAELPATTVELITHRNAERLFGWQMAKHEVAAASPMAP